jgi:hypothetical protein
MLSTEPLTAAPLDRAGAHRELRATRELALAGLLGALAIVVPVLFHAVGMGKVFLPMYLPLLALGLLAGWRQTLPACLLAPVLSALLTGMPPVAVLPLMLVELAALGLVASLTRGLGVWPAACLAVIASRAAGLAALATVLPLLGVKQALSVYLAAAFVTSLPGVILLLTVVPAAVYAIERTSLFPRSPR